MAYEQLHHEALIVFKHSNIIAAEKGSAGLTNDAAQKAADGVGLADWTD